MKIKIYLDDVRTPVDNSWVVARNYDQFISTVLYHGLQNIDVISLDHDLGDTAMNEYHNNVRPNFELNYNNIQEKTGYDCAKWIINHFYDTNRHWENLTRSEKKKTEFPFPTIYTHSANPIGSANIMGYVNNFLMNENQTQSCVRVNIEHTI